MPEPYPIPARKRRWLGLSIGALTAIVVGVIVANSGGRATSRPKLPTPNGYDDIVRAGSLVQGMWPGSGNLDKAQIPEIRAFVDANKAALDLARVGLARECLVPIENTQEWMALHLDEITPIRAAGRLFQAEAMVAEAEDRATDALKSYLDQIALGQAVTQGGLGFDLMVGCAVQTRAIVGIRKLRDRLPAEAFSALLRRLEALDRERVSIETVEARWQDFYQGAHSPYMRFFFRLNGMDKTARAAEVKAIRAGRDKLERDFRFLLVELAIHSYHHDKQAWPRSVRDLVPGYLAAVPIDPRTGKPIDYPANPQGELTDDLNGIARPDGELVPKP